MFRDMLAVQRDSHTLYGCFWHEQPLATGFCFENLPKVLQMLHVCMYVYIQKLCMCICMYVGMYAATCYSTTTLIASTTCQTSTARRQQQRRHRQQQSVHQQAVDTTVPLHEPSLNIPVATQGADTQRRTLTTHSRLLQTVAVRRHCPWDSVEPVSFFTHDASLHHGTRVWAQSSPCQSTTRPASLGLAS